MPVGADSEALWSDIHEAVRDQLAADGMLHLAQLGIEYVEALRSAQRLRALAREQPFSVLKSGRVVVNPLFEAADRDSRRGIQLAKALELVKRRATAEADPFAGLDAGRGVSPPSLAAARSRRNRRKGGGAA